MAVDQSAEFKKAAEDSKKLKAKPKDDEMLKLYSLFKQGCQDPPIDESKAPGMFDFVGKEKRKAWQAVVDKGTTPEQAQKEYIEEVEKLKNQYGYEA